MEDRKYQITLTEPLLGGSPKNERIYRDYVASRSKESDNGETPAMGGLHGLVLMRRQRRKQYRKSLDKQGIGNARRGIDQQRRSDGVRGVAKEKRAMEQQG